MSFFVKALKNLKIGYKITGTLLIILVLAALVPGVGLYFLDGMNQRLNRTIDVSAEKVKLAARIDQHMSEIGRLEKSIILTDDSDEIDDLVATIETNRSQVQALLTQLRALEDEQGQAQLDQFDKAWLTYQISNNEIQSLARENSDRQAFLIAFGVGRERFDEAGSRLADLEQQLEQNLATAAREGDFLAYQEITGNLLLAKRVEEMLLDIGLAEKNLILATTQQEISQAYTDMDAGRIAIQEYLAQLRELISPREQPLLDEFVTAFEAWQATQHDIRKQALANTTQKAIEISQGSGKEAFDQAANHIAAIVDRSDQELAADKRANNQDFALVRNAMLGITSVTIVVGIFLGIFMSRTIARGIRRVVGAAEAIAYTDLANLSRAARAVADGDLTAKAEISTEALDVQSKDELGHLTTMFNQMLNGLHQTGQAFDQMTRNLQALDKEVSARTQNLEAAHEQQVEINQELETAIRQSQRRADLLQASAEVSRTAAQIRDLDRLLPQVTQLISQNFGFYHTGIFLIDEAGRYAVLQAANSKGGQRMLARHHKLGVGSEGIVGYVTGTGQPRIALDVGEDAIHFKNPDLPETRSEMAVPLRAGDAIIGALDVQSTVEAAFAEEDVTTLTALADQITIAIQNARLFEQTEEALEEAEQIQRRYVQRAWSHFVEERPALAHEYTLSGVPSVDDAPLPEAEQAWLRGELVIADHAHPEETKAEHDQDGASARTALAAPIKIRGEIIGVLDLQEIDVERTWTEDEIELIRAVADQLGQALEGARLFEETQRRARREALTRQITERVRAAGAAGDIEAILQTTAEELGEALGVTRAVARLGLPTTQALERDR